MIRAGTQSLVRKCGFEDSGKQGPTRFRKGLTFICEPPRQIVGPRAQRFEVPRHREIHLRGVAAKTRIWPWTYYLTFAL